MENRAKEEMIPASKVLMLMQNLLLELIQGNMLADSYLELIVKKIKDNEERLYVVKTILYLMLCNEDDINRYREMCEGQQYWLSLPSHAMRLRKLLGLSEYEE